MKYQSDLITRISSVLFLLLIMAIFWMQSENIPGSKAFIYLNVAGVILCFSLISLVIRDLYRRDFPDPNSKITWCLLILGTSGIGLLVYLYSYVFRSRAKNDEQEAQDLTVQPALSQKVNQTEADRMTRKACKASLVLMAVYVPVFLLIFLYLLLTGNEQSDWILLIFIPHIILMVLNLLAFILTFKDLYRREFENPNSKLTWTLLILGTGGVGWIIYMLKHILRSTTNESGAAPNALIQG